MKQILIGAIILLVGADYLFWGGPSQLAQRLHDIVGNGASGTTHAAGSIGGMIGGASQGAGDAFKSGLGK